MKYLFMNQFTLRTGNRLSVSIAALAILIVSVNIVSSSAAPNAAFTDIPKGHWAAKAVADLTSKGIIRAKPGAKFNGDQPLTRYEAALYLDRIVRYMENAHKPLNVTKLPAAQIPKIAPGPGYSAMIDLIKLKMIDPKNVIFTAPGSAAITPNQLADATSQVIVRLEDRHIAPPTADMQEN
jgi:hypothetical protein